MAGFDTTIFATKWHNEALHQWQQFDSRLIDKAFVVRKQGAQTYTFPVFNRSGEATYGKAYGTPLNFTNSDVTKITVTAQPIYSAKLVDNLYQVYTDIDLRQAMTTQVIAEVRSAMDDVLITALNASSNLVTLPTANTFNQAGVAKLNTELNKKDVAMEGRYAVVSPEALNDLQADPNFSNNYWNQNGAVKDGIIEQASGLRFVSSNRLPNGAGGGTQRRIFAWNKRRLGVFMPEDFQLAIEWNAERQSYQVVGKVQLAASIIDPLGVAVADITNS